MGVARGQSPFARGLGVSPQFKKSPTLGGQRGLKSIAKHSQINSLDKEEETSYPIIRTNVLLWRC